MDDRDDEKPRLQHGDTYSVNNGPQSHPQGVETTTTGQVTASASDIKQKVVDDIHAVSGFAEEQIGSITNKAKDVAEDQKGYLANKVGSVALAVEKVAAELQNGDDPEIGRVARRVGSTVRQLSEDMHGRSIGEIAAMAEDFGRKQPLAFLGIAAIAGLAASRFLTASAPGNGNETQVSTARVTGTSTLTTNEPTTTTVKGHSNG